MEHDSSFETLVDEALALLSAGEEDTVPVGVSMRHIHLSKEHLALLFGEGYELRIRNPLGQPGQYAAHETVCVAGPKGSFSNVRVLGPLRSRTQLEISRSDAYALGVNPPVRLSGDLDGSCGLCVIGPKGTITLPLGVIIARRHIHMTQDGAARLGIADGMVADVSGGGVRGCVFYGVAVRVTPDSAPEFHVDTDEANAADLKNGMRVRIVNIR